MRRHGKQAGTRQMIELIGLGKQYGYEQLEQEVASAVSMSCWDVAAVRYLLAREPFQDRVSEAIDVGLLGRYERPMPAVADYDQLLSAGGAR